LLAASFFFIAFFVSLIALFHSLFSVFLVLFLFFETEIFFSGSCVFPFLVLFYRGERDEILPLIGDYFELA
jgi:hypothetical protein